MPFPLNSGRQDIFTKNNFSLKTFNQENWAKLKF